MMRSMNSAVSSLKNHQTRMDVIGNNIANVNTVGFKAARTTFKDTYSQLTRTSSGNNEERGGINPSQVGLGMNLSSIDNAMEKGTVDTTNIYTDLYIDGEGFFLVDGPDGRFYTRDGNMSIDEEGYLVNKSGHFLMGYQADKDGNIIQKLGKIQVPIKDIKEPRVTSKIELEGNLDSRAGQGIDPAKFPTDLATVYDKTPVDPTDLTKGYKYTLKNEFSDSTSPKRNSIIGKQVATQVYDSLGKAHDVQLDFVKTGTANTWDVYAFYKTDSGAMVPVGGATTGGGTVNTTVGAGEAANGKAGTGLKFTPKGRIAEDSPTKELTFSLDPTTINGAAPIKGFKIDLNGLTQFESGSTAFAKTNDGYKLGTLTGITIGSDGKVIGKFNNGDTKALGQVATATFANVNGLQKEGDNLWSPTENSGDPNIGTPGAGGNGALVSGALEMSNVDLAKEFTNMIITQRGFQANSRVITTTDQMLEELVNLKR